MEMKSLSKLTTTIEFTSKEMTMLNNALNEVCNGIEISEDEFSTRLGAPRSRAQSLLDGIGGLIGRAEAL